LKITKQRADGDVVLTLDGELDLATVERFAATVKLALSEEKPRRLIIDLAALTFCDSTGIGGFVAADEAARDIGVPMRLRNADGLVRHTLEVTGMYGRLVSE
jgi:anti-sigma B factor antagonist